MKPKKHTICIIGLGYVGLPLAVQCALKKYKIYGLEKDSRKNKLINSGISPIKEAFLEDNLAKVKIEATRDLKVIKKSDIVIICVPTPVDEKYYPILEPIITATKSIANNLKKGQLIIVESTINPGVCEEVIEPIFAGYGFRVGKDYYLAHCPERINPVMEFWP